MTEKQINSEIVYRLAKWVALNMYKGGVIAADEYKQACATFLKRFNPPTGCLEKDEDKEN